MEAHIRAQEIRVKQEVAEDTLLSPLHLQLGDGDHNHFTSISQQFNQKSTLAAGWLQRQRQHNVAPEDWFDGSIGKPPQSI